MGENLLDILWIIIAACLVFIMQAGFALVESGLTRSKNSINVAIKNLTDLGVSTMFFWAVGFGFMFGQSISGLIGGDNYLFSANNTWIAAFFLFQAMFCSTSATIVSGAIAERVKYGAYIIATIFLSVIIYPVFGHWAWGGLVENSGSGWLSNLGFIDFAGSTVVHSLGGWVALAFLVIIGERKGRFDENGKPVAISGSNIPMVVLGVLILWFGWFGFNGGSTLVMDSSVAGIIVKTTLSASSGMVATLAVGWLILKKPDVTLVMNGALAGLVAITAPAHAVTEINAVLIGAIGGLVMLFATFLLEKIRVDDAVGAIPVHLAAGIWGTLSVGLFGDLEILGTGLTRIDQILVQLAGIGMCAVWAFGAAIIFLTILNKIYPLRISLQQEIDGLNKSEHGASTEIFDLYTVLHHQASTGNISLRAPVEPFTEVGQIAQIYNEVLDKLEENTVEKGDYLNILENVSDGMFLISSDGTIGKYYSRSLEGILSVNNLAGVELTEILKGLLMESELNQFKDFIDVAFSLNTQWRHVERLNPLKEIDAHFDDANGGFKIKRLKFDFKRIEKDGQILNLLVLIRDVTEEFELNKEIEETKKKGHIEMELLYKVLHVEPKILKEFFKHANSDLNGINTIFQGNNGSSRDKLMNAFRISHGIKGDAELLDLTFISEKAEELELSMQKILKQSTIDTDEFIPLALKFSELQNIFNKIQDLLAKWADLKSDTEESENINLYFKERITKMSDRLAKKYGKKIKVNIDKLDLYKLGEDQIKPVQDIVIQLMRNSIYHGIENETVREKKGKTLTGSIQVKMEEVEDTIYLIFTDDGAGLDLKGIRNKALEDGIINGDQFEKLSDKIIPRLIFREGLSTAKSTDVIAGKGVGMPLVNSLVTNLNGSIGVRTKDDVGCQFTIKVPKISVKEVVTN